MKRTLILWVVLVGLFVGFYKAFEKDAPGAPSRAAEEGAPAGVIGWVGFLVVIGVAYGFAWYNRRWLKGHNEGVLLLQQGRAVEALERFKEARGRTKNTIPVLNIGVTLLQLFRLNEAVATLEEFAKKGKELIKAQPGMPPPHAAPLALAYALLGDLERARPLISLEAATPSAMTRLTEVVLVCRTSDWSRAKKLIDDNALLLDQLGGSFRALLDAVHALVASKLGVPGGQVDKVRLFRETSSDGLKQAWPELVEFIDRVAAGPAVPAAV